MVATAVLLLLHEPPNEGSDNEVVLPVHTLAVPEIADGRLLTTMYKVV